MIFDNEIIRTLGMTLVHSLWEGLVVLFLVSAAITLSGKSNARLRYAFLVSGLMLLLAGFLATWSILYLKNSLHLTVEKYTVMVFAQLPALVNPVSRAVDPSGFFSIMHRFLEPCYPLLALGWILGFIIMAVRMTGGLYLSHRIVKRDVYLPYPSLQQVFDRVRTRMMLPARIRLRLTNLRVSPMVIGLLKPVVIVPVSILSGLNTEQVEAILVHELAHIRRYDHLVMMIQSLATQILFFNPVGWYLSAGINRERENICDDLVIKRFPNPINYIKALAMIQEFHISEPVPANALMGRSRHLLDRVSRILRPETKRISVYRIALMLVLLISLGLAAYAIVTGRDPGIKKSAVAMLVTYPEKQAIKPDTMKRKTERKPAARLTSRAQDDQEKDKDIAEANRKLEKAQRDLEKAELDLEKAQREMERVQEALGNRNLAEREREFAEQEREFAEQEREFAEQERDHAEREIERGNRDHMPIPGFRPEDWEKFREQWGPNGEQRKRILEEMNRARSEIKRNLDQFKQEDWEKYRKEWQEYGEQFRREWEEFRRTHHDSLGSFHGPHPFFPFPPVPPCPPSVHPQPEVNIPEIPDVEIPEVEIPDVEVRIPEMKIPELESSEPETKSHDTTDKEEDLNSKLREVEEESNK